ncbi:MAG: alpha/beta hydrolase [Bacillota bacterium]
MRKVTFKNSRGQRLAGVWHRAAGGAAACGINPVLIICHGFRGSKDGGGRAVEFGAGIAAAGYHVMRFDFSGTGDSEGEFASATLTGYMDDLAAAVEYAGEKAAGPVIVLGRSFGGTTAICQAAIDGQIAGVCTWAAPAKGRTTVLPGTFQRLPI